MSDPPAIETAQAGVSAERAFLVFTRSSFTAAPQVYEQNSDADRSMSRSDESRPRRPP